MSVSRRQFIKISGGGLGMAAAASGLVSKGWGFDASQGNDPRTDGDQVIPTFCEMCFWKCGLLAHVKDGRVTKLVGNPAHPLSQGHLCPRGTGGTGLLYDPDRIQQPLVRSEKRGEQEFRPVSWDDALNETAARLDRIRKEHGPEAMAFFIHGFGGSWFNTLATAYGTGNIGAPGWAQCRGAREVAYELTFGSGVGSPEVTDIENSRVLTLMGSHLGENMHNTQVQELARAIERGAELVVVDPRYSTVAGKARYWLPIKPGTDIALLLAWMHVIIEEGLYDATYIDRYAVGMEQLRAHVADKTPQWAFVRTGIRPEVIVETARFIAGGRPGSLIHPGRRAAWYGDDTQRGRATAILNALLGAWGHQGGLYIASAMSIPKVALPKPEHQPLPPNDMPTGTVYPFGGEAIANGLRDASIPGTHATDVKGWMVYATNLIQALPEGDKTIQALQALDSVIVVDMLPSEIAGWADVVLPEATYLERHDDLFAPPYRQPFVALRQPVIEPMYNTKPGWWIAKQVAERLGLGAFYPFEHVEEYLAQRTEAAGIDLVELSRTGVVLGKREPTTIEEGVEPAFDTPSGKIELYSEDLAAAGLLPMPEYTPPRGARSRPVPPAERPRAGPHLRPDHEQP